MSLPCKQYWNTFPLGILFCGSVTAEASKSTDDILYDIITDEELGQIQEGDSIQNENRTEEESLDRSMTDLWVNVIKAKYSGTLWPCTNPAQSYAYLLRSEFHYTQWGSFPGKYA